MAKRRKKSAVPVAVRLEPLLSELAGLVKRLKGRDPQLYLALRKFHQKHANLCKAAVIVSCPKPRR
ncbi:MAG TPA: hypothetical protein VMS04_05625 [Vicinamibacterales bacterium]|jgi:hypothetical protein|nr:hypothetical protein [Vicinamibacterales bacterium]